ncbi:putative indole-3-pyruvate monooxygenase YUCCA3 [Vanrija pseudolonga]|uniref:Indole-3-pyruvate monooxygenase YUCCA3 n=1 Tax=Vanrija pseudolonga TaxID=143232 RepID=A0AAF1BGM2_9TREE|nr:putative indole-3-pyruvate monooxygenase YUCCA3 [Vanrija pseudolonga]
MTLATYFPTATAQLPAVDKGYAVPKDTDVRAVATKAVDDLASAAEKADANAFAALFDATGFWRDVLAFTRDLRAFPADKIKEVAEDVLAPNSPRNFTILSTSDVGGEDPVLETPFPDFSWIRVHFDFETSVGHASGLLRLVYNERVGAWKIYTLYTSLDDIHGWPQRLGQHRILGRHNDHLTYAERRAEESEFKDSDPDVLVIGAGHNGLSVAAVLQSYGLSALAIDREDQIGDNWRNRYSSLSLHDPVHTNHLSFMNFPKTWPTFTPAGKLANWLEQYADALELNVWLRSTLDPNRTRWNESNGKWEVTVVRTLADGSKEERPLSVSHIVMSTGLLGGKPKLPPPFPGQDSFTGTIAHSSAHSGGAAWAGKRALVVGAATSGHDIAFDLVNNGAEVTMLQRTPTFIMSIKNGRASLEGGIFNEANVERFGIETLDRIANSFPRAVVKELHKRTISWLADVDSELLDGLKKAGFKTTPGPEGAGWLFLGCKKGGGYYFSTGASEQIANGKIKVQQGEIASMGPGKVVKFTDGTEAEYDLVVLATGYTGFPDSVRELLGEHAASQLGQVWGMDDEGELYGVARPAGIPNVFFNIANLGSSRTFSKIIAVQVLGQREGVWSEPYKRGEDTRE